MIFFLIHSVKPVYIKSIWLILLISLVSSPLVSEPQESWVASFGASRGLNTIGFGFDCSYAEKPGFSVGMASRVLFPVNTDSVIGLTTFQTFVTATPAVGWRFAFDSNFRIFSGIAVGAEFSYLQESVIDPNYGINDNYTPSTQ